MSNLLVIRFSALGDVAMTVPVVASFAIAHPDCTITVLSNKAFSALFSGLPSNVLFYGADLKGKHKGMQGLNTLYNELKIQNFDYVGDLHSVLRTHFLRTRFALAGVRTSMIDKGRRDKKALTRPQNKRFTQLTTSFERYHQVFQHFGFIFPLQFKGLDLPSYTVDFVDPKTSNVKWIGVAPFAKHAGKIYPANLMSEVLDTLSSNKNFRVFVFGGGKAEKEQIDRWCEQFPLLISMVGKLSMEQELMMMSQLDVMCSMDSANMHLASLLNVPVVSVWGATHPYAGFMGWNQQTENAVQLDLPCRPCSVFGDKPCLRGDYACLTGLKPAMIIQQIESVLLI